VQLRAVATERDISFVDCSFASQQFVRVESLVQDGRPRVRPAVVEGIYANFLLCIQSPKCSEKINMNGFRISAISFSLDTAKHACTNFM
jgi:hypothetical protein